MCNDIQLYNLFDFTSSQNTKEFHSGSLSVSPQAAHAHRQQRDGTRERRERGAVTCVTGPDPSRSGARETMCDQGRERRVMRARLRRRVRLRALTDGLQTTRLYSRSVPYNTSTLHSASHDSCVMSQTRTPSSTRWARGTWAMWGHTWSRGTVGLSQCRS